MSRSPFGASAILIRGGSVLMVRRDRPPFSGLWSFPGGRLEPGEDAESAVRREVLEETGLCAGPLLGLGSFRPDPGAPLEVQVFCGRLIGGEPQAGDDAQQAELVPFERVLQRPHTPGAVGWLARAIAALGGLESR